VLAPTVHILMAAVPMEYFSVWVGISSRTMEYLSREISDSIERVLTLEVVNEGIAGLALCEGGQKRGNITRCICALVLVVQTFLQYYLAVLAYEGLRRRYWQSNKDDTSLILLGIAGFVHGVNMTSGLSGDERIARAARARQDWFAFAVAQSQIIFVLLSLIFGCSFLATSGSLKDISLNLLAVGFIPSVDNMVVQALRKALFNRDADEEWQVQVEYPREVNEYLKTFSHVLVPLGYGYICACIYCYRPNFCDVIHIGGAMAPTLLPVRPGPHGQVWDFSERVIVIHIGLAVGLFWRTIVEWWH